MIMNIARGKRHPGSDRIEEGKERKMLTIKMDTSE